MGNHSTVIIIHYILTVGNEINNAYCFNSIQILNDVSTDGSFSYKPPDVSYMGRRLKMKFKIAETGKEEWFEGQITTYNGLNGKYGVFFPVDKQVVFIYPTDKDIIFLST